ncbi:MAG: hypothetical protein LBT78_11420 [Tannerella sp.]|jgi:hypothetical protein|nr:hypothetical protein [Tannerella sp.]
MSILNLFTGSGKSKGKEKTDENIVELTTAAKEVRIYTISKAMTIHWGDGQTNSYTTTYKTSIKHSYAKNRSHTIRIKEENLTMLYCSYNQLIALDMSRNTALTMLGCSGNRLTAEALNALSCSQGYLLTVENFG